MRTTGTIAQASIHCEWFIVCHVYLNIFRSYAQWFYVANMYSEPIAFSRSEPNDTTQIYCVLSREPARAGERKIKREEKRKKEEEMFTVTNTLKSQLKERTLNSRNERGCFIQFSSVVLSARFESVALLLLLFDFLRVTLLFSYLYLLRASFLYLNELNCVTHYTYRLFRSDESLSRLENLFL